MEFDKETIKEFIRFVIIPGLITTLLTLLVVFAITRCVNNELKTHNIKKEITNYLKDEK